MESSVKLGGGGGIKHYFIRHGGAIGGVLTLNDPFLKDEMEGESNETAASGRFKCSVYLAKEDTADKSSKS